MHLGGMLVWSCRAYVVMDDVVLAVLTPASMLLTSLSWWDNYVSGKKVGKRNNNHNILQIQLKSVSVSLDETNVISTLLH